MRREPLGRLLLGLATGTAFGALLQRGGASSYDAIVSQLLLRDHHVGQLMANAAASGAVGTEILRSMDATELSIQPLQVRSIVLGGIAFGTGMTILGYCPGTSIAAAGEGRRDAMWGVAGMLAGALVFVRVYPAMKSFMETPNLGKQRLPTATRTPAWGWVAALAGIVGAVAASRGRSST